MLGVAVVYGADALVIARSTGRRGGRYQSLYVEEVCTTAQTNVTRMPPGQILIDTGFVVRIAPPADFAPVTAHLVATEDTAARALMVLGADGVQYGVAANFSAAPVQIALLGRLTTVVPDAMVVVTPDGILA